MNDFGDNRFEGLLGHLNSLPYLARRIEARRLIQPPQSRFIYKYRTVDPIDDVSVDHLRDILVRSRLWLSSPFDFNDPFDMCAKLTAESTPDERRRRFDMILKERGVPRNQRKIKLKEMERKPVTVLEQELSAIFEKYANSIGICSFAGDPKSILMWSHYANEHAGVCIQLERIRDYATLAGALAVEYSPEYPKVQFINDFVNSLRQVILRKYEGWSYEDEHRIVMPSRAHTYLDFSPDALAGIIIGCRTSAAARESLYLLLEERRQAGLPPVKFFMAKKHKTEYRLCIAKSNSKLQN